jgi:Ca2+-binding RTX toxin-like protein
MRSLLALTILLTVLCCAPARAGTVSFTPGTVEPADVEPEESCSGSSACAPATVAFRADAGETNVVTVTDEAGTLVFRDTGARLIAGAGCTARPDGAVGCPAGATSLALLDGDDRVQAQGIGASVTGGDGSDVISGAQTVEGGPGNDTITGTAGADRIKTGGGVDVVDGGAGDDAIIDDGPVGEGDRLDGGAGLDEIWFAGRLEGVTVDLGARPQTAGTGAEANVVANFERATGGEGPDVLLSDPAVPAFDLHPMLVGAAGDDRLEDRGAGRSRIEGGEGDDTLRGGAGSDDLDGGPGRDALDGGADGDRLVGGSGDDALTGGPGGDLLFGGSGRDSADGGAGPDRVKGEKGADRLTGGAGNDTVDGGDGADVLSGGAGRDRMLPGGGADRVLAGAGNDSVGSTDRSRDRISCGAGRDRLTGDRRDRASGCERVRRSGRTARPSAVTDG